MALEYQIITFYEFKDLTAVADLSTIRESIKRLMADLCIRGTVILAAEGFNSTVGGQPENIERFIERVGIILDSEIKVKSSFHDELPFKRIKVKIKPEIVTLKKNVDISKGLGTHVDSREWNTIIADPSTIVLDARNDYEYRTGTFKNAINPETLKFNDLPDYVSKNLDPGRDKKIAMFCTGGIRCEKFAPYLKGLGFDEVYQLKGGILNYIEETKPNESLWEGECFVFDERVTVDEELRKGTRPDHSQPPFGSE